MKFDMSCKVYSFFFSKILKKYYETHFKEVEIKPIIKEVKKEYKEMILRTPSLSKDNFMAGNLKGAAYFFAMAKKVPNMTPALMDEIVLDTFEGDFMKGLNKKKREKGLLFGDKYQDKMLKDSLRSQKSEDEMDWRFTYHKGVNECSYEITKCGVCQLAKREGLLEYLPSMCKMDYPKYKIAGAKLTRDKTLANHDECCNFHLERIKNEE